MGRTTNVIDGQRHARQTSLTCLALPSFRAVGGLGTDLRSLPRVDAIHLKRTVSLVSSVRTHTPPTKMAMLTRISVASFFAPRPSCLVQILELRPCADVCTRGVLQDVRLPPAALRLGLDRLCRPASASRTRHSPRGAKHHPRRDDWSSNVDREVSTISAANHPAFVLTMFHLTSVSVHLFVISLRLAEHLLSPGFLSHTQSDSKFPSRVLELGSGVGFLGALAGKVMAHHHPKEGGHLVLTDLDERVLGGLRANLDLSECMPLATRLTPRRSCARRVGKGWN